MVALGSSAHLLIILIPLFTSHILCSQRASIYSKKEIRVLAVVAFEHRINTMVPSHHALEPKWYFMSEILLASVTLSNHVRKFL